MVTKDAVSKDFRKQILGYGLTTAEIVYRRPDRHWLLQTYIWQDYDMFRKNHSKARYSRSPSHIRNSLSLPNCTPSMASFDCIDSGHSSALKPRPSDTVGSCNC